MKTKKMILAVLAVIMMMTFASVALADTVTLTGMVEATEDGPVLNTGGMNYILDGSDLDAWVGIKVKVTGTVEDGEGDVKFLVVENIEETE